MAQDATITQFSWCLAIRHRNIVHILQVKFTLILLHTLFNFKCGVNVCLRRLKMIVVHKKLNCNEQASIRDLPRGHTDFYRLHIGALMLPIFTVTKLVPPRGFEPLFSP